MKRSKKKRNKMQELMDLSISLQEKIIKADLEYMAQLKIEQLRVIEDIQKFMNRFRFCPAWLLQKKTYFGW